MNYLQFSFIVLVCCLVVLSCQTGVAPEQELLMLFQQELAVVEQYQNNYVSYMEFQCSHFTEKQEKMIHAIKAVNQKYAALSYQEQRQTEALWKKEFQPVIDAIYQKTTQMIVSQKANMTPEQKARIQALSIQRQLLERKALQIKLTPSFFSTPAITEN